MVDFVQPRARCRRGGCAFALGGREYDDDVFEREGVVVQLPLESDTPNRGMMRVAFDGDVSGPKGRRWGHCGESTGRWEGVGGGGGVDG